MKDTHSPPSTDLEHNSPNIAQIPAHDSGEEGDMNYQVEWILEKTKSYKPTKALNKISKEYSTMTQPESTETSSDLPLSKDISLMSRIQSKNG